MKPKEKELDKKTNVMRLNTREANIINFLRETNINLLIRELSHSLDNSSNVGLYPLQKKLINLLDTKEKFSLNHLIKTGFITQEQADHLIRCIEAKENVIISGNIGTGKTTLLNALLNYSTGRIMMFQRYPEIQFEENTSAEIIESSNYECFTMKDMSTLLYDKVATLVMDEIIRIEDILSITSALNNGINILGTAYGEECWKETCFSTLDDCEQISIKEALNRHTFEQVIVTIDSNGKRKVREINRI